MSFSEQLLNAFIELLEDNFFSEADRAELQQLIEPLPDNLEQLSDAIATWAQEPQRAQIYEELLAKVKVSNSDKLPGSKKGKPPRQAKPSKPELLNAIQRSNSKPKK